MASVDFLISRYIRGSSALIPNSSGTGSWTVVTTRLDLYSAMIFRANSRSLSSCLSSLARCLSSLILSALRFNISEAIRQITRTKAQENTTTFPIGLSNTFVKVRTSRVAPIRISTILKMSMATHPLSSCQVDSASIFLPLVFSTWYLAKTRHQPNVSKKFARYSSRSGIATY